MDQTEEEISVSFIQPKPICLHSQSECKLQKERYRVPKDNERSEIHFPLLDYPNLFDSHEVFHVININKVIKDKTNIREYLKNDYDNYQLAVKKYRESLPAYNKELLQVFIKNTNSADFDAIVFPSSSSEWLRDGLVDIFVQHYQIDSFEAKKNQNIMLSRYNGTPPAGFKFLFESESVYSKRSIIILDDCYCYGSTVDSISKTLGSNKCFAVGCYIKNYS